MPTTIVIVDDHLLIAKAITSIIEQFNNYQVLYECENGKELISRLESQPVLPKIVLLDISMPEMDGFETALWLRQHYPSVLVMALTMQANDESLFRMIQCGVKGYLQKNVHPSELETALNALVQKGFYYPDWATNRMMNNIASSGKSKEPEIILTEREKEFLNYCCTELTYKEIGEKMNCSPRTVESYRDNLFEKLKIKTRVALALFAAKTGIFKL